MRDIAKALPFACIGLEGRSSGRLVQSFVTADAQGNQIRVVIIALLAA